MVAVSVLCAQPQSQPRFEVATLKLSPPPEGDLINIDLGHFRNGRFTMANVTLNDAIKFAYELVSDDLLAGPDWNRSVRFDIAALAPSATPPDRLHMMVQALLAERLHLVVRQEERVLRYLALIPGKNGTRLVESKEDVPDPGPQVRGRIMHPHMTMALLVTLLSRFERQTIVDRTGLSGTFAVKLEWAPDATVMPGDLAGPPPERPSLFAAVKDQMGLRLESRRGPLKVLVVEQAAKIPIEN